MCKYLRNFLALKGMQLQSDQNAIRPEFELVRDFMPVLVTSKCDKDPIKSESASLETPFSHKSMGNFLDAQEHLYSERSGPIWPKF